MKIISLICNQLWFITLKHSWYIPYGDLLLTDIFIIFTIRILHNDSCLVFEFRLTHQVLTICWKIQIFNFKFLNWNDCNTSCASIIPNSYYTIFSFLSRSHHVSLFINIKTAYWSSMSKEKSDLFVGFSILRYKSTPSCENYSIFLRFIWPSNVLTLVSLISNNVFQLKNWISVKLWWSWYF